MFILLGYEKNVIYSKLVNNPFNDIILYYLQSKRADCARHGAHTFRQGAQQDRPGAFKGQPTVERRDTLPGA